MKLMPSTQIQMQILNKNKVKPRSYSLTVPLAIMINDEQNLKNVVVVQCPLILFV